MDWDYIQKRFDESLVQDVTIDDWYGHRLRIRRIQDWDNAAWFLTPEMDMKDIYLDYAYVAEAWREAFGVFRLRDFITAKTRMEIMAEARVSVRNTQPWRIYAGSDDYQWMYPTVLAIHDLVERFTRAHFPAVNHNDRWVWGDAGAGLGVTHGDHHQHDNTQVVCDLNYYVHAGYNMTQYRRSDLPDPYCGYRNTKMYDDEELIDGVVDLEQNYVMLELLNRICPVTSSQGKELIIGGEIYKAMKKKGWDVSFLTASDTCNHPTHMHLKLSIDDIDWDTEMVLKGTIGRM